MISAPTIAAAILPLCATASQASDFFPEAYDVRMQKIEQQGGEAEWPFLANNGTLMCMRVFGMKQVIFLSGHEEYDSDEYTDSVIGEKIAQRMVQVTVDPIQLFADFNGKKNLDPTMTIEEKIRRMAPYVALGKKLCDQPKGTILGPSEL